MVVHAALACCEVRSGSGVWSSSWSWMPAQFNEEFCFGLWFSLPAPFHLHKGPVNRHPC